MATPSFGHLSRVSDEQLIRGVEALLGEEHRIEAELLAHLAEIDARKLYLEHGFDSMFRYCIEGLRLSEASAYHRIRVARVARRFPRIFELVASGRMHVSCIAVLAAHLTEANHARLLEAAAPLSKREVEEMVATLFPQAAPAPSVERVPEALDLPLSSAPARASRPRAVPGSMQAVQAEQYKVQFAADRELRDQIEELRALLRHQVPTGDLGEIFRRAIGLLLTETKRKRFAETDRPQKPKPETRAPERPSRHIPAEIKRAVYQRDGGRCTYVATDGRRCGSRDFLEFHHEQPWATHARHRADEITLRCRGHNALAAREAFGDHMRQFERPPELSPGRVGPCKPVPKQAAGRCELSPGRVGRPM